jgi:hypothetical protein
MERELMTWPPVTGPPLLPATPGQVVARLGDAAYDHIRGNLIIKSDPRYAWVPLGYRRPAHPTTGAPADVAEIFLVAVQARNYQQFTDADISRNPPNSPFVSNLRSRAVEISLLRGNGVTPDRVAFNFTPEVPDARTGTYLLIGNAPTLPELNGRIYRLGNRVPTEPNVWELLPGVDMDDVGQLFVPQGTHPVLVEDVVAYMVGQGYRDPAAANPVPEGPAMDLFTPRAAVTIVRRQ